MKVLVIAEHDNATLKPATAHLISAALQLGNDISVLVAGHGCAAVAAAAGHIAGVTRVLLADNAAYAITLAHIGPQLMAVTSHLTMSFLRGAQPGDLHAEVELLRLGRRLAVCDVRMWSENPERLAAQANVTYAIPG